MASSSKIAVTGPSSSKTQNLGDFVEEPNILDEQAHAWYSQVLIPSAADFTHAFLGPLPDPVETDEIKEIFPSHHLLQPRIFSTKPFHLEFLSNPNRVFRSAPKVDHNNYIAWLDKIQAKKAQTWEEQGIFDLIQLSRHGPKYNSTLILAALYFWDSATHSLHLKCGMLSPTLLDVAAITGLKPLGETFDPKIPSINTYDFNFDTATFNPYINDHYDTTTDEVSDLEYIAFLTLWLSIFVLCSRSLQVTKTCIPLAIHLHEGRNVNLAKLILSTLYQHLDNAILELKEDAPTTTLLVSGPMWLLQLWLYATFESRLNLHIPKMIRQTLETRRTKGIRLAQLRPKEINVTVEDSFSFYLEMFLKCNTFTMSMAPFVTRTHGPTWFTREFPSPSPEHAEETNQIWQAYLSPAVLSTRLSASKHKNNLVVNRYFPSYSARQFGLCQLRPAPVCLHRGEFNCPETEREYKRAFEKFHYNDLSFEPIRFNPRFSCTKKFHDWWLNYYTTVSGGQAEDDLLSNLISAFLPPTKEDKSKGMHHFDTKTFHKYFNNCITLSHSRTITLCN